MGESIMNTTVRFYSKKGVDIGNLIEIDYKEYRIDGSLYSMGTEQFSIERYRSKLKTAWIMVWDGQAKNKGGYRKWEEKEVVHYTDRKALNEYAKNKYSKYALVQIRS